jgi:hypothetical protein
MAAKDPPASLREALRAGRREHKEKDNYLAIFGAELSTGAWMLSIVAFGMSPVAFTC